MHDGTVRDLIFIEDTSNRTSLLVSGGAGNCHIHVTDCTSGTSLRALQGHTGKKRFVYSAKASLLQHQSLDSTRGVVACSPPVRRIRPFASGTCVVSRQ